MSADDESVRAEEPRPPETPPAPEPTESPKDPPKAKDETPADQDDLTDESMAGAPWAGGSDHLANEGMRSLGVDPDAPARAQRTLGDPAKVAFVTGAKVASVTGAKVASGNAMAVEQLIYNAAGSASSRVSSGLVSTALIKSIVDTYVPVAGHDAVRDSLQRHGVVYVSGPEDSGRMATAHVVLAELCGHDKIVAIDLPDGADLGDVLKQGDVLRAGHGHVLELPANRPAPKRQTLAAAGGQFAGTHFHLVVVGPPGPTDHALHPYEVRHQPPPLADVLDQHLPYQLRSRTNWSADQIAEFVTTCQHAPGIAERLYTSGQPGEIVQLARRLVDVGLRGGQPDEVLELLPGALRELAVTVLRDAKVADDAVQTLRRLTARIAFGLFSSWPLTVVFELASLLFEALPPEQKATADEPSELVKTVFDGGMDSLIDDRMRAKSGDDDTDGDRLARLVDPELALALLDVVWHDYDHLRVPLMAWLSVLGGDTRQQVCVRAGQLAGQLALYDFGVAYDELLRPWARSRRNVHRQSAAWAMERAVIEPRLTARVRGQVQDWVLSPNEYLNDTAARAYATRFGTDYANDPLLYLWLVAMGSELVVSPAVAAAVARLYDPDDPEFGFVILTQLTEWTADRRRSLHVHAARAVTFLAHRTASQPHERWPALLRLAAENPEARELLVGLWRATLTEPMVAATGWRSLLAWLLRPTEVDELHEFTVTFTTDVFNTPMLRARAVFHLSQWRRRHPDALVLRQLRDTI